MFDQVPTVFKVLIVVGVVMAAPLIVFSIIFSGVNAAMIVILALVAYFATIYIVGVRRYMKGE
jgi:hypothetical protein